MRNISVFQGSLQQHQIGIRQEIGAAVADQDVVEALRLHQAGNALAVVAQVHQHHLAVALGKETAQAVGVGVPDHKDLAGLAGVGDPDQGVVAVQEDGVLVRLFQPV